MSILHFLLTPDRSSARRVRRMVAENSSRLGVMVGTWTELVEQARKAYVLPDPDDSWNEKLAEIAASMTDAFWAKSLEVAPGESLSVISSHLTILIEGAGPAGKVTPDAKKVLPDRARKHLADLAKLHEAMNGILPTRLAAIKDILNVDKSEAIRTIFLYQIDGLPKLSPWQKALVNKIETDFPSTRDKELENLLNQALVPAITKKRPVALAAIQDNLFSPEAEQVKLDDSVQWLAVRDYLEEAEVAAGMVQTILKEQKLKPADIGLLVPSDNSYVDAIRDSFSLAGIPVSGLDSNRQARDLGREAVLNFLITRRWPAPVMAIAALYTNPLMPWKAETGMDLANEVMDGNFDPWLPGDASHNDRKMADLIKKRDPAAPSDLAKALRDFGGLLNESEKLEEHQNRAQDLLLELTALLPKAGEIPWKKLLAQSSPSPFSVRTDEIMSREGVAVFSENEEPWRRVTVLIVFGFSSGRYPAGTGSSPIFFESDIRLLKEKLGYSVESPSDEVLSRRQLFRRQLLSATDAITFLIPRRDAVGTELHPSDAMPFMAKLFIPPKGKETLEAGDLLFELDTEEGRTRASWLALAKPAKASSPWTPAVSDLNLGQDLLKLRVDKEGKALPESPSVLETLMVSPLAWLLIRKGLEPRKWAPEDLDVSLKGILTHDVFEQLFNHQRPVPPDAEIRKEVTKLFMDALRQNAPFLQAPEWYVERMHLEQEILDAALWWRERLIRMGARILGAETWLNGTFDQMSICGKTDLLVEVPASRLFVVDYKKSSSGKYRTMMREGFASQVALYRIMLQTGDYSQAENKALASAMADKKDIGVLYALLNDHKVLTDSTSWLGTGQQDVTEMGQAIADKALDMIRNRFADLRNGIVKLNKESDEERFADAGIT
jgi:hypothetical protein